MSDQSATAHLTANVGIAPVADRSGTVTLTANMGAGAMPENYSGTAVQVNNIGLARPPTITALFPQKGWGIPLAPERSALIFIDEVNATAHLNMDVLDAAACEVAGTVLKPTVGAPQWVDVDNRSNPPRAWKCLVTTTVFPEDGVAPSDFAVYALAHPSAGYGSQSGAVTDMGTYMYGSKAREVDGNTVTAWITVSQQISWGYPGYEDGSGAPIDVAIVGAGVVYPTSTYGQDYTYPAGRVSDCLFYWGQQVRTTDIPIGPL